jgi:hypothetical protein
MVCCLVTFLLVKFSVDNTILRRLILDGKGTSLALREHDSNLKSSLNLILPQTAMHHYGIPIPLEILWEILVLYEQNNSTKELLRLRLVSSKLQPSSLDTCFLTQFQGLFNDRVLSKVFTSHRSSDEECIIDAQSWKVIPWSLKQQYLQYKIARFKNEPTFFAYLFIPVLERTMAVRGIIEDDITGKDDVANELLGILKFSSMQGTARFLHHHSDFKFIVDKQLEILSRMTINDFLKNETYEKKLQDASISTEFRTASICCAVLRNDIEAFRSAIGTVPFDISMHSTCFETNPLYFTYSLGTDALFECLLGHSHPESMYASYSSIVNDLLRDSGRKSTLKILLNHVAKMGSARLRSDFIRTIFQDAVNINHFDFIDDYLAKLEGFNIPKDSVWKDTLEIAVQKSRPDIFNRVLKDATPKFLIAHRANLLCRALGRYGTGSPNLQIVQALLKKGVDPNCVLIDNENNADDEYEHKVFSFYDNTTPAVFIEKTITPLQVIASARKGAAEIIQLLLNHGADVNDTQGTEKLPPIFLAANYGSLEAMRSLLKGGATPCGTVKNKAFLEYAHGGLVRAEAEALALEFGWDVGELESARG